MITNLRLQNFRSYSNATFEFGEGVNIIVGANASGKTNLLESVLVLCRGGSYRAPDKELIQHDADWLRLDGVLRTQERTAKIQKQGEIIKKQFEIGGTTLTRLPLNRTIPVVVFEPNHLQLLTESPELRRGFVDDVIEQIIPSYGELRKHYKRALAQRNRLLKQDFLPDQIFVWNLRLSELGGQIAEKRMSFIYEHKDLLAELYNKLAGKEVKTNMIYETKQNTESYSSSMLKELENRIQTDQDRGYTTTGPHRDDMGLLIDGFSLASAASRGETRTMLIALKLLEVRTVEKARETKPIILLDDVFSELDGYRRRALTDHLKDHQTFITTTDADIVVQHFLNDCTVIPTGIQNK